MPDIRKRIGKIVAEIDQIDRAIERLGDSPDPSWISDLDAIVEKIGKDVNQIRGKVRGYLLEVKTAERKATKADHNVSHDNADIKVVTPTKSKFYQLKSCSTAKTNDVKTHLTKALAQGLGLNGELIGGTGAEIVCEVVVQSSKNYWPFSDNTYHYVPDSIDETRFKREAAEIVNAAFKTARDQVRNNLRKKVNGQTTLVEHLADNFSAAVPIKVVIRFAKPMVVNPAYDKNALPLPPKKRKRPGESDPTVSRIPNRRAPASIAFRGQIRAEVSGNKVHLKYKSLEFNALK
mgnify:CR=1 FL=1